MIPRNFQAEKQHKKPRKADVKKMIAMVWENHCNRCPESLQ